jgi:hypothetical protein
MGSLGRLHVLDRGKHDRGFCTMVHGDKGVMAVGACFDGQRRNLDPSLQRVEPKEERQGQDHQFGAEQDKDAGVVEAPTPTEAAGGLDHRPCGGENGKNLPGRSTRGIKMGKASKTQAGSECAEGKQGAAEERSLAEAEDGRAKRHPPM